MAADRAFRAAASQTATEGGNRVKVRIMHRLIQEVPTELWTQKLEMERRCDEVERRYGHPLPRRYRAMFGAEKSQIRVCEREYESFEEFARRFEAFYDNEELMQVEADRHRYINWEREELYYVDSGQPTPRWMEILAQREAGRETGPQG